MWSGPMIAINSPSTNARGYMVRSGLARVHTVFAMQKSPTSLACLGGIQSCANFMHYFY